MHCLQYGVTGLLSGGYRQLKLLQPPVFVFKHAHFLEKTNALQLQLLVLAF